MIGSCFGKWHFPRAAGIALTAGQGSPAREGARGGPRLLTLSSPFRGDVEGQVLALRCVSSRGRAARSCHPLVPEAEAEKTIPLVQQKHCEEGTNSDFPCSPLQDHANVRLNLCFFFSYSKNQNQIKQINKKKGPPQNEIIAQCIMVWMQMYIFSGFLGSYVRHYWNFCSYLAVE